MLHSFLKSGLTAHRKIKLFGLSLQRLGIQMALTFSKYFLSAYSVPGTLLSTENIQYLANRRAKGPALVKLILTQIRDYIY